MYYGRDKYECFQDINQYKYLLVRLILSATHDGLEDTALARFAANSLRLLGIDILFTQENFAIIRERLDQVLTTLPAEGTPPYIPADEPVFLLRSSDPLGYQLAQDWVTAANRLGVSGTRIKSAQEQVERMKTYHLETRPIDLDD